MYKERGHWSSHQELSTESADQKHRLCFLGPDVPALMVFSSAARISGLLFSAAFLQPYAGGGRTAKRDKAASNTGATILGEKSFLPQYRAQGSYFWVQAPNITFWAQNPLKETKPRTGESVIEHPQSEWTWTENMIQRWEQVLKMIAYHRTTGDIYGVFNMEP